MNRNQQTSPANSPLNPQARWAPPPVPKLIGPPICHSMPSVSGLVRQINSSATLSGIQQKTEMSPARVPSGAESLLGRRDSIEALRGPTS